MNNSSRIFPRFIFPLIQPWRLCLLPAIAGFALSAFGAESPRYLFLDPALLSKTESASLRVNPAQRREVVIRADKPWENLMISFYTTVRDEGGKLRLWYLTRAKDGHGDVGYAESSDGVHWTKPELGIIEYQGSKANNMTGAPGDGAPFIDPNAPADERYVCVSNVNFPGTLGRYTSPDGLHWKRSFADLLPFPSDTQNTTFWDARLKQYVIFFRGWTPKYRNVKRIALPDLITSSGIQATGKGRTSGPKKDPRYVLDEVPTVLECDQQDPTRTDIYTMAAQPYPLDPSWYVAFPTFLRRSVATDAANYKGSSRGPVETQFAGSRDTIHWERYDRSAYASPSPAAPEKRNMVFMGTGLVVRGDEIWQYATEFESEHGDSAARQRKTDGVVVRYVQRVDGFVSLNTDEHQGTACTVPVRVTGSALKLNLDTGALGELRVALLDATGKPLAGFEAENCQPLQVNSTGAAVKWAGRGDLTTLQGRDVIIEFHSSRTKLYSFRFE